MPNPPATVSADRPSLARLGQVRRLRARRPRGRQGVLAEHAAAPPVIVEGTFALALPELIAVATLTVHVGLGVRTPPSSHPVPVRSCSVVCDGAGRAQPKRLILGNFAVVST
ncbi:hypothetical protein [Nocardia sp. NPDC058666]|uniref:hypothetical protein n=1 Tax=Nocardia sp. NPDC058666 TaxID=3346587 RepID=UPI003655FEA5